MLTGRPQFRQKNRNRSYSESQSGAQGGHGHHTYEDDRHRKASNLGNKQR